jgi:hypothetical protein
MRQLLHLVSSLKITLLKIMVIFVRSHFGESEQGAGGSRK